MKIALNQIALWTAAISGLHGSTMAEEQKKRLRSDGRGLQGTCKIIIAEKETSDGARETLVACENEDGTARPIEGLPEGDLAQAMADGSIVSGLSELDLSMTGDGSGSEIVLPSDYGAAIHTDHSRRRKLAVTGTKSVLVVRVIAADDSTTAGASALRDSVFGTAGDPVNLKSQYLACSNQQLNFVPATGQGINNGVATVTISTSTSAGDSTMNNDIATALNAKLGVSSPRNAADHVMYCLPPGTMNGIAYAYINSWLSVYDDNWCMYPSGQIHEIGHNLGLAHSNENGSYRDQSGMMGFSYSQDDGPNMCFNGAKLWQLGWFSGQHRTFTGTADLSNLLLVGSVDFAKSSNKMVLKIQTGAARDFYVWFNRKTAHNSGTVEGGNQVLVVSRAKGNGYAESELEAKLNNGGSFQLPSFGECTNPTLSVTSLSSSNGARVSITGCSSSGPDPTPAPVAPVPVTPAPVSTPEPTPAPVSTPINDCDCSAFNGRGNKKFCRKACNGSNWQYCEWTRKGKICSKK